MECSFAENLRRIREEKLLSRQQLAAAIGVTVTAYANYENGIREPNLTNLMILAQKLEVTTDELLGFRADVLQKPRDKYNDDNFEVVRGAMESAGFKIEDQMNEDGSVEIKIWKSGKLLIQDDWAHMALMVNRIISDAYDEINSTVTKQIQMLYDRNLFFYEESPEKWHLWRLMVDYDFLFVDAEAPFSSDILPIIEGRQHNPFTKEARIENAEAWSKYVKRHMDIDSLHI